MHVRLVDDPREFLDVAGAGLLRDEARHNLILGLAATLRDHPGLYPEHRLWIAEADGEVVGAALRTPPHNLVLAQPHAEGAVEALASAIPDELPGVVGALPEAQAFATAWSAKIGSAARIFKQGIYALEQLRPVTGVRGKPRRATTEDRPLLLAWSRAFAIESLHEEEPDEERIARSIELRLTADDWGFVLWEDDGEPVSLLYTDLANPTSNRMYERIGYECVCESAEIEFLS